MPENADTEAGESSWHVMTRSERLGVLSEEEVIRRLSTRELDDETHVWRNGMEQWTSVTEIEALAAAIADADADVAEPEADEPAAEAPSAQEPKPAAAAPATRPRTVLPYGMASVPVGTLAGDQITLRDRLKYRFDNFMASGGLAVFLALAVMFVLAFIVMGGVRTVAFLVSPDAEVDGVGDLLWRVFFQIIDAGALAELDSGSNLLGKLTAIATVFLGLVLFSSMVAFITQQFEARIAVLRKGMSKVAEHDHTLILGFTERVFDMVTELTEAFSSEKEGVLVIVAPEEKERMDDALRQHIEGWHAIDQETAQFEGRKPAKKSRKLRIKNTRFVTRTGSLTSLSVLRRVGIKRATSVVILNEAPASASDREKLLADARVLKSVMAVVAAAGTALYRRVDKKKQKQPRLHLVAELHDEGYRALAKNIVKGQIRTLNEASILARMLVQTSRCPGLSVVYGNLVGFEGNEFYFFTPPGGWAGMTFGDSQLRFAHSVPLGIRVENGTVVLNPEQTRPLLDTDELVVLAEDDRTIGYSDRPVAVPRSLDYPTHRAPIPHERQLILGWSNKTRIMMKEYAEYLADGSEVDLAVNEVTPEIQAEFDAISGRHPGIQMSLRQIDIDGGALAELEPYRYNNVQILAGNGRAAEEIDSMTIMTLLQLRQIFCERQEETGQPVHTQLITEVAGSGNEDVVLQVGVKDFLMSNQLVSKILAQVSQEAAVMDVYDDLFSEKGSEVYLKPVTLYFEVKDLNKLTFADCVVAAQARGEVCMGFKRVAEEMDKSKHYGVYLLPDKNAEIKLSRRDVLITLAVDET